MKDLELKHHQFKIVEQIMSDSRKKLIVPMDTGTGKTITALTILTLMGAEKKRSLIIAPPILINNAWLADNEEFNQFQLPITPLVKQNIEDMVFKNNGIYITSYNMVMLYERQFKSVKWDIVILDECHKIANRGSKTSLAIAGGYSKKRGKCTGLNCDRAYLFTGTMVPNNEEQILQQIKMCGYTNSWTAFKNKFFDTPVPMHPYIIKFKESMREEYNQLVAKYTTEVIKKEDTELSDIQKNWHILRFKPDKEMLKIQDEIIKDQLVQMGDKTITIDYTLSELSKLRQVSRGFIMDEDKNVYNISRTPYKIFGEFVNDRADKMPFIVWYCFKHELEGMLDIIDTKINRWVLSGGLSKKVQDDLISGFKKSDNGIMFIQYGVGKNGLTLTNCRDMIFFSLEDNNESFTQAQDRIHRIGQKESAVNYYTLQSRGMIDNAIYQSLINKGNMLEDLKDWLRDKK